MDLDELRQFMLAAHGRFHDLVPCLASVYPGLVSFTALDTAKSVKERMIWGLSVSPQIGETINCANDWCQQLHIWNIWLHVLPELSGEQRWELESSSVNPVAFFCMLQPAAHSDRLLELAENLLHQANLIVVKGYEDRLDQDSLPAGRHLQRKQALEQADRLGQGWAAYSRFRELYCQINGKEYRRATANFRNRAVHSLASRWTQGDILAAARSIEPWEDMVQQEDGGWLRVPHPKKKAVRYAIGAQLPLDMARMHALNLEQYRRLRKTMVALEMLVSEIVTAIHVGCRAPIS